MRRLVEGVRRFQETAYPQRRDLFARLAGGQSPHTLFITCSDSRIDPSMVTQAEPGELFVIRNAGNIVPGAGDGSGGEAASVEYAVEVLGVRDVVVCGHSHCGAMAGLLDPDSVEKLPHVAGWLRHAEETARRLERHGVRSLAGAVEENVRVQLESLMRLDFVRRRVEAGKLTLHGWIYRFEHGDVLMLDPKSDRLVPVASLAPSIRAAPAPSVNRSKTRRGGSGRFEARIIDI